MCLGERAAHGASSLFWHQRCMQGDWKQTRRGTWLGGLGRGESAVASRGISPGNAGLTVALHPLQGVLQIS